MVKREIRIGENVNKFRAWFSIFQDVLLNRAILVFYTDDKFEAGATSDSHIAIDKKIADIFRRLA